MSFSFQTNLPYPDRIQWLLNDYSGSLVQFGPLGSFDPRRDLEVYVDGILIPVRTFTYDAQYNRYLMYMDSPINLQGVIQVVHRMPNPPFVTATPTPSTPAGGFGLAFGQFFGGIARGFGSAFGLYFGGSSSSSIGSGTQLVVPGFSLLATYSTSGDVTSSPTASFTAVPQSTAAGNPITLLWNTTNIEQVQITADNGVDAPLDSGRIDTQGLGTFVVSNGVSITTTFTLNAYDNLGHLVLSPITTVTV